MTSCEHFVNFPPARISLLLKRSFAPSNLADTFKTGQFKAGQFKAGPFSEAYSQLCLV